MSARNMVRNLRDSGMLESKPPAPNWRSGAVFFLAALAFGAAVYLGAAHGLPGLIKLTERKAVQIAYAKPAGEDMTVAAIAPEVKPFNRTDDLACQRFGDAAAKRIVTDLRNNAQVNPFAFDLGTGRLGAMSAQLICEAQTRPMRLCDETERASFAERARPYLAELTTMVGVMGGAMNAPAFSLVPPQHDGAVIAKGIAQTGLSQIAGLHAKVTSTFRDLASRGLISEGDFGTGLFGAPEVVRMMFADLPAVEAVCPVA